MLISSASCRPLDPSKSHQHYNTPPPSLPPIHHSNHPQPPQDPTFPGFRRVPGIGSLSESHSMGAAASSEAETVSLGDLHESCVAVVLGFMDPVEVCRVARVNRAFRAAAGADVVWGGKVPENFGYLLEKGEEEEGKEEGLREVYKRLCRANPFDGGNKVFWLEKSKGGICMSISSKALSITGIDDRRYWSYIPTKESRFHNVAYLQQIWWLEVDGEIEFCFPVGTYSLFFRLQLGRASKRLGRRVCNTEQIHGWNIKPVKFQLSTSSGQHAIKQCYLDEPGYWIHYHVGDFVVESSSTPTRVKFSMIQIDCTHTKGGLCVDSVLIYPSGLKPQKVYTS